MKAKIVLLLVSGFCLQACSLPNLQFYVRNYSASKLDIIIIFNKDIPDSLDRQLITIEGTEIKQPVPSGQNVSQLEKIDINAYKVNLPAKHSLFFPQSRSLRNEFYDSTTVLLVKDHYLVDTLFHDGDLKYLEKFQSSRTWMGYKYQYIYNYQ